MSRLPCEPRRIQMPMVDDALAGSYSVLPAECAKPHCHRQAVHSHHAVPRNFTKMWWTQDWALLDDRLVPVLVPLCREHHDDCTENRAMIAWEGWWYYEYLDPPHEDRNLVPISHPMMWPFRAALDDADDGAQVSFPQPAATPSASSSVEQEAPMDDPVVTGDATLTGDPVSLPPGTLCPTCNHKIPRPRKSTSPESTTVSHRLPRDVKPEYYEIRDACIEHLGIKGEPYDKYKMFLTAMILLLQTPHKDIGGRVA